MLRILLNRGDASFDELGQLELGFRTSTLMAADLDADSLPDLVAVDAGADTVNVFWNPGDGRFSEPSLFGVGDKPNDLVVADLDSDGDVDLADVLAFQAAFTGAR